MEKIQKLCWKQGSGPRSGLQCATEIAKCVVQGPEHMLVPLLIRLLLSPVVVLLLCCKVVAECCTDKHHCPPQGEEDAGLASSQALNQESKV